MTHEPAQHSADAPLRLGVLGAARIIRDALVRPAPHVPGLEIAAIAARDHARAQAAATQHKILRTHTGYDALLADPEIDAVYVPLPVTLHEHWAKAALDAGKHVLVEKPFTANATQAEHLVAAAESSPTVLMEAYHSGHHPLTGQLRKILDSGEIGTVRSARAVFCVPVPPGKNIRWNLALGGGSLLDVGYYPVRLLRELFGEPTVTQARARQRGGIDRALEADLLFPHDIGATIVSSLWSRRLFASKLEVTGEHGQMSVSFPYHPQMGAKITLRTPDGRRREPVDRTSTYVLQLRAFVDAARNGAPIGTDAPAALLQMQALDAIYRAAGMSPRGLE
ncbi:Gfo/Idh/MocA family protein [Streptomyces sp. ALB3]|uniref:Gfo/Idh/MocA family protein n=1 Tax=Streptomyces sp. ALB3 TaxID=3374278 RepID=UPI0037A22050